MSNEGSITGFNDFAAPEGACLPVPGELAMDADKYRDELADLDLTEDQVDELLAVLWDIMRRMVELGFSAEICGSITNALIEPSVSDADDGSLGHPSNKEPPSEDSEKKTT